MTDQERAQLEAIRRLIRWVGKGVANGLFLNCTCAPQQAEHDMNFAQKVLDNAQTQIK